MSYVVGKVKDCIDFYFFFERKDCIDSCKHNFIGKRISNKPIDIQAKQKCNNWNLVKFERCQDFEDIGEKIFLERFSSLFSPYHSSRHLFLLLLVRGMI